MANTTIVVQFGSPQRDGQSAAAHLSAEIDSRPDGLNGGKTSFLPGDRVGILVFKTPNVAVSAIECSSGSISTGGNVTVTRSEELTFANSDTANLSVPASGALSTRWMGRSLGTLSVAGDEPTAVRASSRGIGVARVSFPAQADSYWLNSPATIDGLTDFSIVVVIVGEVSA